MANPSNNNPLVPSIRTDGGGGASNVATLNQIMDATFGVGAWSVTGGAVGILAVTDGATVTFNIATMQKQSVVLGGNRILAFSNTKIGQAFTIILYQDGTGSRTVTWPNGITWPGGGSAPTLQTAPNAIDCVTFVPTGAATYLGFDSSSTSSGGGSGITGVTGDVTTAQNTSGNVAAFLSGQTNVITPAITASQNNFSPTGWLSGGAMVANVIRVGIASLSAGADVQITGLVAPSAGNIEGVIVTIQNSSTSIVPLHLVAASAGSGAANRFAFASDAWINPGDGIQVQYDNTATQWREFGAHKDLQTDRWGNGYDGPYAASSGTTTLTRDTFYTTGAPTGTAVINTAGFKLRFSSILDLSGAQTGCIINNGGAGGLGGNGTTGASTVGTLGAAVNGTSPTLPVQVNGSAGGAGQTGNGSASTAPVGRAVWNTASGTASSGGAGGAGGTGSAGAATPGPANVQGPLPLGYGVGYTYNTNATSTFIFPGTGGTGGSGGGGDGTNGGGAGGGGGASAGAIDLGARFIYMGSNTNVGIIQAIGGIGGAGGNGSAGNTGGGGGGGGGSGGIALVNHGGRYGSGGTNAIDVTGGNGGAGGNLHGTGAAANGIGGQSGLSGSVLVNDVHGGAASVFTSGVAKVNSVVQAGATATTTRANL